jgi:hypothetical protein
MKTISSFPPRRSQAPFCPAVHTAKDWDEVRTAFSSSILVDTPLTSLAQNLEGIDWPLNGREETPAAYIDLTFEEMRERLAMCGQPPRVGDQLIDILRETLAFDDPFGDMVALTDAGGGEENPVVKNLARLQIPADFPVALTTLSSETLLFCRLENVTTLGEFALIAQRMAGAVIVGGDFRALLNALSSIDERTIARYLPFRVGAKGLHYIEGLGQAVCAQPVEVQAAMARRAGQPLSAALQDLAAMVSDEQLTCARTELMRHALALRPFCDQECAELLRQVAAGADARRLLVTLGDPMLEAVVADLITPERSIQKSGWRARLLRWWRK